MKQKKFYPLTPKFWQPKVLPAAQLTSKIYHHGHVATIMRGKAETPWAWVESGLVYSEMMRLLEKEGVAFTVEAKLAIYMQKQMQGAVIERYLREGKVEFNSPELAIARAAALVMDQLIEMDRHNIAWNAYQWAKEQTIKLQEAAAKEQESDFRN